MARGSNSRRDSADTTDIARDLDTLLSRPVPRPAPMSVLPSTPATDQVLTSIEDRRLWSPYEAPAMTLRSIPATVVGDATYTPSYAPQMPSGDVGGRRKGVTNPPPFRPPPQFGFAQASKEVLVCVRRKSRREVLFARGKGGGSYRKRRKNAYSEVKC